MLLLLLLYLQEKQKRQKEKADSEEHKDARWIIREFVNKIVLLVGAGLTVKNAWKKIVDHYEEYKEKKRFAYEAMNYVCGKCKVELRKRSVMSILGKESDCLLM